MCIRDSHYALVSWIMVVQAGFQARKGKMAVTNCGLQVHLVELADHVLPPLDAELAPLLANERGWNFGVISGTALVVDATAPEDRAKTQGSVDVLIALAGATGGAMSGMVVASSSFAVLALGGGVLAVLLIPVVIWSRRAPAANLDAT